jgi:hypothetical protein
MYQLLKPVLLIYCIVLFALPNIAHAQTKIRTLSPVRIKIELSGKEPRPDGVAAELLFGGGGAGENFRGDRREGVYWIFLAQPLSTPTMDYLKIHLLFPPVDNVACGYISDQPAATLTFPGGSHRSLTGVPVDAQAISGETPIGCWKFTVEWYYGMELGLYTLTLDGNEGTLSYTWGMDYGYCRGNSEVPGEARPIQPGEVSSWLFTGFTPNENITVHFYADTGRTAVDSQGTSQGISEYVATRTFQADAEGAFMLDVSVTRSAPFAGKGIQYRIQDYGDESDENGLPSRLHPDNLACFIEYDKQQPGRPVIPLYPAIDNLSQPVGALLPNQTATLIDVVPMIRNGKVILWAHFVTETGQEGWTLEPDLPGVVQ